jgi:hypothetical protein
VTLAARFRKKLTGKLRKVEEEEDNLWQSGLPDFYWSQDTKNGKKYTKLCIPNCHKIYQMAVKYSK